MSASAPKSRTRYTGEPRRAAGSLSPTHNEAAQASRSVQVGQAFLRIDPPEKNGEHVGQLASSETEQPADARLARALDVDRNPGSEPLSPPNDEVVVRNGEVAANQSEPEAWLTYHATDLIDRLTHWSEELSVRESNLNAREAIWERRARRLRLQFQETQYELDQLAASLHQERADLAVQQAQLQRTARQLAMATL